MSHPFHDPAGTQHGSPATGAAASRTSRGDDAAARTATAGGADRPAPGAPSRGTEDSSGAPNRADRPVEVHAGHHELIIRGRYETLSIANDILIGVIFLVGSFLFFQDSTVYVGTWLFVVGSVLMLIRPSIRITRHVHLQRLSPGRSPESVRDF